MRISTHDSATDKNSGTAVCGKTYLFHARVSIGRTCDIQMSDAISRHA